MGRRTFKKVFDPNDLDLKASSISSRERPCVSGMKNAQIQAVIKAHPPKRKYAPKLLFDNRIGVVNATRKFVAQLLPCAKLVADARVLWGWISAA